MEEGEGGPYENTHQPFPRRPGLRGLPHQQGIWDNRAPGRANPVRGGEQHSTWMWPLPVAGWAAKLAAPLEDLLGEELGTGAPE